VPSTHFNQFIYVDEAQQLDIQTIQQASFVPLDGAPKLNFAHSVVWLKLEETQTIDDHRNWYMKFLPAMVTQATVYTASEFNPNEWDATTWTANELALPIPLSANPSQGAVYVRLLSPWNFRLNLMIDSKDKIDLVQRRIDMFVIMITTMTLLAFVLADEQLVVHPFHRVVHAGAPDPLAWDALAQKATVTPCTELPDRLEPGTLCVVHGDQRWLLVPHDRPFLDVDWCSEALLAPLWGIHDLRTDKRLTFVPGTESLPDFAAAQSPEDWWIGLAPTPWLR
jgi:hypothetical protein